MNVRGHNKAPYIVASVTGRNCHEGVNVSQTAKFTQLRKITELEKHSHYKHEEVGSIPRTHVEVNGCHGVLEVVGQRQADPWDLAPASQSSLIEECQASEEPCYKEGEWFSEDDTQGCPQVPHMGTQFKRE